MEVLCDDDPIDICPKKEDQPRELVFKYFIQNSATYS